MFQTEGDAYHKRSRLNRQLAHNYYVNASGDYLKKQWSVNVVHALPSLYDTHGFHIRASKGVIPSQKVINEVSYKTPAMQVVTSGLKPRWDV